MITVTDSANLQSCRLSDTVETVNVFSENLDNINSKTQKIEDSSMLIKEKADLGTKKINDLILVVNEVTENTKIVRDTSSDAIAGVEMQSNTITDTVSVFNNIVEQINNVIPQIGEVANTLEQTILMKDSILSNIESISSISENVSDSAEEVSALIKGQTSTVTDIAEISRKLNRTSDELIHSIEKFNI